ncbi:MAG: ABC transporter ATP-binding protein [Candidatus Bipolaricaulota bacterium]
MCSRGRVTAGVDRVSARAGHPIAQLRGVTKRFPGVVANDAVDLDLYPGEVHALLGENGAGKSTLMKILYGFYSYDAGSIHIDGREAHVSSPLDARKLGIGMVFQVFTLIPAMTVAENVALYVPGLPLMLDARSLGKSLRALGNRCGLRVDPSANVRSLPIGDQQKVEVLKLLVAEARILIFDEATRVLAPHEIEGLFEIFEMLKKDGYAIVFITHKMREVLACADRITVMRRGKVSGTVRGSEATEKALIELMFGGSVPDQAPRGVRDAAAGDCILELRGVSTRAHGVGIGLRDVDLAVRSGEIVGVAGVSGNGQRELTDLALGLAACTRGERLILGSNATAWGARRVRAMGVGFIPEDPLGMGVVPWMTLAQNAALGDVETYSRYGGLSIDWQHVRRDVAAAFAELDFEPLETWVPVRTFSGGQLQRAVLARELGRHPRIFVASYPTRGLDVRSATATRRVLAGLRSRGGGVLLISEDLDELFQLSDRLVVLREGRIVGQFLPQELDRHTIGHLMTTSGDGHE